MLSFQELLGLEGADVDSKDSGIEEGREEDSGDVLWDLHDEQEQIESYQQACSSTTSQLGFQKVGQLSSFYIFTFVIQSNNFLIDFSEFVLYLFSCST